MKKSFLLFSMLFTLIFSSCGQQQSTAMKQKNNLPEVPAIADYIQGKGFEGLSVATFAGGCFWCTEASFERIEGVKEVISGYSGGEIKNPSYRLVAGGGTKHTESIQIYYDSKVVSFETLLEVFFVAHDGTQLNRQGPDRGPQYRSEIFYHNEAEKEASEAYIKKLNASGYSSDLIVTRITPYQEFWVAEEYHQDYYPTHQDNPYIANVSKPKVEKVEKKFKDILKKKYKS